MRLLHDEDSLSLSKSITVGIPRVLFYNTIGNYNFLIMEELGASLETLLQKSQEKKFSLKTVLQIGIQSVSKLLFN